MLDRPVAPILLLISIFYIWVYLLRAFGKAATVKPELLQNAPALTIAT
jgi:hypothetical protein